MTFEIDEAYLPVTLSPPTLSASQMTDEEFQTFCAQYPDYFIEMSADGEIIIMPPNFPIGSFRAGEAFGQLRDWNSITRTGFVLDGTGGYVLPNGARRSPDAAWVSADRVRSLDQRSLERYWHFCPEFVIELRSATDRLAPLRAKMREWIANGAELAWMIDPERKVIEIFRPGEEPETVFDAVRITAGKPVQGFTLELARIRDPLATS